jgi:hypothetical protein
MTRTASVLAGGACAAILLAGASHLAPVGAAQASSHLAGVVVDASRQPVRRATVTLQGGRESGRSVVTDDRGRFAFDSLDADRFVLSAAKPAYITSAFGAKRPGGPGTSIVLGVGERLENLVIVLSRGAALAGRIRNAAGQPAPDLEVRLVRISASSAERVPVARDATVVTDEDGYFRAFGLLPGSYLVAASSWRLSGEAAAPSKSHVDAELRALLNSTSALAARPVAAPAPVPPVMYAPVFFPGTAVAEHARPVVVESGSVVDDVDFALVAVPAAGIRGVVASPVGRPETVSVNLVPHGLALPVVAGVAAVRHDYSDPEGRFAFRQVSPGTYTIIARSNARSARVLESGTRVFAGSDGLPDGDVLWGMTTVTLAGGEVVTSVQLRPTLTLTGRVVVDAAPDRPSPAPGAIRLTMTPAPPIAGPLASSYRLNGPPRTSSTAVVATDGTFAVRGLLPGWYTLEASIPGGSAASGWWMRSALAGGTDLLDGPIVIGESTPPPVTVRLSAARTELTGAIADRAGQAVAGIVVAAFPANRTLWWEESRRMQAARPDTRGRFVFHNLPPGEYLLAALTDIDEDSWRSSTFLEPLIAFGVPVRLAEGATVIQDLRIR